MGIRFAAPTTGFNAEEMRLHGFVTPREEFHADALCGFQDAPIALRDETRIFLGVVEERKKIGAIEAGDTGQGGDGSAHLATFESAKESDGDSGSASDLRKREIAFLAKASETLARRENAFRGNRDNALAFEDVNDCRGVESARAAKKNRALQNADVFISVETVFALRALGNDEAERLPGAKRGRGNTDATSYVADAKERLGSRRFRSFE